FRVSNGTCCLLMSKSEVYGNTIQVQRNSANKVTRITPAARPAINIGYDGSSRLESVSMVVGSAAFTWTSGKLTSFTVPNQSGNYVFEYPSSGDVYRIRNVTWPGGGAAEIITNTDNTVQSISLADNALTANYVSATRVDLTDRFTNVAQLQYTA